MRPTHVVAAMLVTLFVSGGSAAGAPAAKAWPFWDTSQPSSATRIDHSPWDRFLRAYVVSNHPSGINRVRYADVTRSDRRALEEYLAQLQAVSVRTLSRDEQEAYWINLYNALTVDVVLDHFPVASIMEINISPGLFSRGPWGKKLVTVDGQRLSLDDVEHRILRPIWKDPRVHYAVNCASLGCPNLQPTAFTADNTDRLLTEAAREYVDHPRSATARDNRLIVSSIYVWFQEDFGGTEAGVLAHLRSYMSDDRKRQLASYTRIDDHAYDWRLNSP